MTEPMGPAGEVCPECKAKPVSVSPHWRWNGVRWEHYHGYPVGHIPTELPEVKMIWQPRIRRLWWVWKQKIKCRFGRHERLGSFCCWCYKDIGYGKNNLH